jgi:predicted AAA+ superfamily ATPase
MLGDATSLGPSMAWATIHKAGSGRTAWQLGLCSGAVEAEGPA